MKKLLTLTSTFFYFHSFAQVMPSGPGYDAHISGEKVLVRAITAVVNPGRQPEKTCASAARPP